MEKAILQDRLIVALEVAKTFAEENEVRKASGKRQLRCPDPTCSDPVVKYCRGEKKTAYFSHLTNVSCDYARYDKETPSIIKEVKVALFESFVDKGYQVDMDVKLLERHYTHLMVTLKNGDHIAIEIGSRHTYANKTDSLAKQYADAGISVKWIVVDDSSTFRREEETNHIKRFVLNTSKNRDVLVVSTDGKTVTQSVEDFNVYPYKGQNLLSKNYPRVFSETAEIADIVIDNGELTLPAFHSRFENWLNRKKTAYEKKVEQLIKEEEKKKKQREEQEKQYQEQERLREEQKKLQEKKWLESSFSGECVPCVGMKVFHISEGELIITEVWEQAGKLLVRTMNKDGELYGKNWEILLNTKKIRIMKD